MSDRAFARAIALEFFQRDDPAGWFDVLYKKAGGNAAVVPWADGRINRSLEEWLAREKPATGRALVIGCGLGQDAAGLAAYGFSVTAFDISPDETEPAKSPASEPRMQYCHTDLFSTPPEWRHAFDFVFECYTVQTLPPEQRARTIEAIANFVAPAGRLLLVSRARDEDHHPGDMPWPLTEREVRMFENHGLRLSRLEDYMDREDPPVRRWRALFERTME